MCVCLPLCVWVCLCNFVSVCLCAFLGLCVFLSLFGGVCGCLSLTFCLSVFLFVLMETDKVTFLLKDGYIPCSMRPGWTIHYERMYE